MRFAYCKDQFLFLEEGVCRVDTFVLLALSAFGTVVMTLCFKAALAPIVAHLHILACGWAFASDRHTITTYM